MQHYCGLVPSQKWMNGYKRTCYYCLPRNNPIRPHFIPVPGGFNLLLEPASSSFGGVVSTGPQKFSGLLLGHSYYWEMRSDNYFVHFYNQNEQ